MITLITGLPGSGKTALVVSMMLQTQQDSPDRTFYTDGIPDLALTYEPLPSPDSWTKWIVDQQSSTGQKLMFTFPQNSIVIIDECQRIYRPRASSSKVPDIVAAFETHRHLGLDFWLITQSPALIDINVRNLVGRHIHVHDSGVLGRHLFEWTKCGDIDSSVSRSLAAKRSYKLPKVAFTKYKSAEIHTKTKRRIPVYVYVFLLSFISLIGTGAYIYRAIDQKNAKPSEMDEIGLLAKDDVRRMSVPVELTYAESYLPRLDGLPHTAPVFDQIQPVRNAPFPAACVATAKKCQCYTDQVTELDMPYEQCRTIVQKGLYNPSLQTIRTDILQPAVQQEPPQRPG